MTTIRRYLRRAALIVGFGGAGLALLTAGVLDKGLGRDVLMLAPHDAETVELNRLLYSPGDSVPEIYGNPLSRQARVLFVDPERIVKPEEDPTLSLLPVDKAGGDNPLQVQTIWFFTRFVAGGLLVVGIVGLFIRRKRGSAPSPVKSHPEGRRAV